MPRPAAARRWPLPASAMRSGSTPRGITRLRRETCQFPPLRVEFAAPPPATSLFGGQRRLKLVTHCRPGDGFQQHLLLEYAAYRLYNLLTPASFRARLATIDYVDDNGDPVASRVGFFIEDKDDVGRRIGLRSAAVGRPGRPSARLEPRAGGAVRLVPIYDRQSRLVDARGAGGRGLLPQQPAARRALARRQRGQSRHRAL